MSFAVVGKIPKVTPSDDHLSAVLRGDGTLLEQKWPGCRPRTSPSWTVLRLIKPVSQPAAMAAAGFS